MTVLKPSTNPIFGAKVKPVDLDRLSVLQIHRRKLDSAKREIRDARKVKSAREAIAGLDHENEIYGFTKGQFSLLDLIAAVVETTGPCHFSISTWTAATFEIGALGAMAQRGDVTGTRWLIDFSMARREPATTSQLRETFGRDNIRVAQNYAKWALFQNTKWKVVLRSSMNLNMNPRNEDFTIAHDPDLAAFLNAILDEIWAKQTKEMADAKPYEIVKHWENDL